MAILALDHFTGSDGTSIVPASHTPDIDNLGNGWANLVSSWTINGNQAKSGGKSLGAINEGQANVTIQGKCTVLAGGDDVGLAGRIQDNINYWLLGLSISAGLVRLFEVNANSFTLRHSAAFTTVAGTQYLLKLLMNGTNFTGYVDGVQYVTYSSSFLQTQTSHGMFVFDPGGFGRVDDFQIDDLATGGPFPHHTRRQMSGGMIQMSGGL